MKPILFGMDESVYVRIARLALEEKGIEYDLVPVDPFAPAGPGAHYLARHPFGRIPAFEHDGFRLYETGAITRYVDEAFGGMRLQPDDIRLRARMNQFVSIADSYAYRTFVWDVFVERINKPARGEICDEAKVEGALVRAQTLFAAICDLVTVGPWLVGDAVTLADLYLAAMIDYFVKTDEGRSLVQTHGQIDAWWSRISHRPSMLATRYPL